MIDEIVKYCHEQYQKKPLFCENCDEFFCTKGCKQCLHDIHFTQDCHRNYDCPYMCHYYVCQNIYKYVTEMAYIWRDFITQNIGQGKPFQQLEICSIGCGPCSELIALEEYSLRKNLTLPYSFVGFDIERTWNEIQNVVKSNSSNPNAISFEHCDVFDYYNTHNKPNIIVLNYVLSSMVKNAPDSIIAFINMLSSLFGATNPCAILINDINHYSVRKYFDALLQIIIHHNSGITFQQYNFLNTKSDYTYPYGSRRGTSVLWIWPSDIIKDSYTSNTECHSAQLMIIKK